jgi:hypothetical protein
MKDHVDKETFKQIFRDHWPEFVAQYPRYKEKDIIIEKMLGCGDPANGYSEYICPDCLEIKRVAFSCKSKFCLSCARAHLEEWISKIEASLFEGVDYRHLILTVPEQLRVYFYREPKLLDELVKTGLAMIKDVLETYFRDPLEAGYIVVLQTAGRSAGYNPHLHIMMTAGGLNSNHEWRDIKYIPFSLLHKKFYLCVARRQGQYHLFEMIKREVKQAKELIDKLYRKYPKGIVAHIKMEKVPKKDKLAQYLIKYVGSPPIALSRIVKYTGEKVRYWYKDHRTSKKEEIEIPVLQFIGRMVQHVLPPGFKQVRYYGLHATCKAAKVREFLKAFFLKMGRVLEETIRQVKHYSYRQGIVKITGKDPFICEKCGAEMWLWQIYHPKYGIIYDELKEMERWSYGQEEKGTIVAGGTGRVRPGNSGNRGRDVLQLSLFPV